MRKRKGFTLAELITAVAIFAMLAGFISVIFKSSIDGYRSAGANAQIMQNLRAITEQLNRDFEGLCKDAYLIIRVQTQERNEYQTSNVGEYHMDRLYYFTTGDFQSWDRNSSGAYIKSNIARVFWGHDSNSLSSDDPLSTCKLARDIVLLTPGLIPAELPEDCRNLSLAQIKNEPNVSTLITSIDPNELNILDDTGSIPVAENNPDLIRRLICKNIGEFRIDWSMGEIDSATNGFIWYSEDVTCGPNDPKPKAIKFIFTLYDSKEILQGGRRFSHIVYLGD